MEDYTLQILIPTYNREPFLKKNIILLDEYIRKLNLLSDVSIIVCDNVSTDNTAITTKILANELESKIYLFNNEKNIGLERNAVNVLEKATADYVMFLGDDDYIELEYLREVYSKIKDNNLAITCIVPSFYPVDIYGNRFKLSSGRDVNIKSYLLKPGKLSASKIFYKGHQLSGITFKREGTLDSYINSGFRNIYLFMYFVGFNAMRGNTYHFTDYPVKVTQPGEDKKDWSYGKDGLVNERFKNSKALFGNNYLYRFNAEKNLINNFNNWFLFRYLKYGAIDFIEYIKSNILSKYLSIFGKIYFIIFSIYFISKKTIKRVIGILNVFNS